MAAMPQKLGHSLVRLESKASDIQPTHTDFDATVPSPSRSTAAAGLGLEFDAAVPSLSSFSKAAGDHPSGLDASCSFQAVLQEESRRVHACFESFAQSQSKELDHHLRFLRQLLASHYGQLTAAFDGHAHVPTCATSVQLPSAKLSFAPTTDRDVVVPLSDHRSLTKATVPGSGVRRPSSPLSHYVASVESLSKKVIFKEERKNKMSRKSPTMHTAKTMHTARDARVARAHHIEMIGQLTKSMPFIILGNVMTGANIIFLAVRANWMWTTASSGSVNDTGFYILWVAGAYFYVDALFCAFFLVELFLRLFGEGLGMWYSNDRLFNLQDAIATCAHVLELALLYVNATWAYTMAVFRVLRVFRILKTFKRLRRIQHIFIGAFRSLIWALMYLFLFSWSFALLFMQAGTRYVAENPNGEYISKHNLWFGTFFQTMTSLFMCTTGGIDWWEIQELLQLTTYPGAALFLVYISVVLFGVLNILTAIFVAGAHDYALRDRDLATWAAAEHNAGEMAVLTRLFQELDVEESGIISQEVFCEYAKDDEFHAFFMALGIDVSEPQALFRLIDVDMSGGIEIDEFVMGCMGLKGNASRACVETLLQETRNWMKLWTRFSRQTKTDMRHLQSCMDLVLSHLALTPPCSATTFLDETAKLERIEKRRPSVASAFSAAAELLGLRDESKITITRSERTTSKKSDVSRERSLTGAERDALSKFANRRLILSAME